ncbi:hypothetical protein JHK86_043387 [Glycine max]|nr:hypothetical protein JHK86_043387 [Glycine max]
MAVHAMNGQQHVIFQSIWRYSARNDLLEWEKRLNIIGGIAQGLLYLHKYSRLKVIHQDLKASNILLDHEMKAKISDFGMASNIWKRLCVSQLSETHL